ncbi:hypothetical protein [Shewanella sp. UCD-KL12]|uniref:hypothetical protein n=1 Tax=Shewanella sp. UCD-KL12 TaxID=1917163 RepID=UPI0009704CB1|nr:hypothetical protein [Shewanella sp. UCD-KL12]
MIGFDPTVFDYNAMIAIQFITSLGLIIMITVFGAFAFALFQEWKTVREYTLKKRNCKFFESLSRHRSGTK